MCVLLQHAFTLVLVPVLVLLLVLVFVLALVDRHDFGLKVRGGTIVEYISRSIMLYDRHVQTKSGLSAVGLASLPTLSAQKPLLVVVATIDGYLPYYRHNDQT